MDKKLEILTEKIYKECAEDGEPVSMEEAREMAEMEIKAKSARHYEQTSPTKKRKPKERKVDEPKKHLLGCVKNLLIGMHCEITSVKTETEIKFNYQGDSYTFKLTRHRPKK